MDRLTRIISMATFLLLFFHLQGMAQEPVRPPEGLPEERWEMSFNYWNRTSSNNTRVVTFIRDGNDLYIRGIFYKYSSSWIKCTVDGDKLIIPNGQLIDTYRPTYFHWGACCDTGRLSLSEHGWFSSSTLSAADDFIFFAISEDGNTITSQSKGEFHRDAQVTPSFWYDNDERGDWVFDYTFYQPHSWSGEWGPKYGGSGYPDVPYIINMAFRKINTERAMAN